MRTKSLAGVLASALLLSLGMMIGAGGSAEAAPQYNLTCSSCHTMPPTDSGDEKKNPFTGGVPGRHQTHAGADKATCVNCHDTGILGYDNSHRNKTIELKGTLGYNPQRAFLNQTSVPPNPLGSCSTAACHSNGKGVVRATPAWSSTASATCDTCHDAQPSSNKHATHLSYYGGASACVKCHSDHAGEAAPFQHATSVLNRGIDVHFASGGSFSGDTCSNLYCHSNGRGTTTTPSWTGANLDCTGCHGNATTDTLSAKHSAHVNNSSVLGSNYGCVKCHAATVSDNTTIFDKAKHVDGTKDVSIACSSCHQNGKGGAASVAVTQAGDWNAATTLDCKGCHGSGTSSAAGEPTYANGGAGQPTANSHAKHAAAAADCIRCHSATIDAAGALVAGSNHTDGNIDVLQGGGKTFTFTSNDKTCSNISCHSGGGIVVSVGNAQWGASLGCAGCHGNSDTTLTTNAHAKHLTKGYACDTCHNATVSGSTTIISSALHANSAVNVAGTGVTFTASPDKTCATSCHMSATPKWGDTSTGACGSCHAATSPLIATNAHTAHFTSTNGPGLSQTVASCQLCHTYTTDLAATHVDNTVNLNGGFAASGTCSSCHTRNTTSWTSAATVTCESCHTTTGGALSQINGVTAPDKTLAASAGHGQAGINQNCAACHDSSSAHINGSLGDNRLLPALGAGNTNCTYCHNDPGKVANADKRITQVHIGTANTCAACHDPHGAGNSNMVLGTLGGVPVTFNGTTFVNASGTGVCQACHTGTAYYKQNVAENNHYDSGTNCLECHSHKGADGLTAFEPSRQCDSCHGYPPAPRNVAVTFGIQSNWSTARFEDYSGGGGAHLVAAHLPKGIKPSDGWAPCLACHNDGAASHNKALPMRNHVDNVTVKIDQQYRFSNDYFAVYTTAKFLNDGQNQTGTCFNVSCHFKPTEKWSTER